MKLSKKQWSQLNDALVNINEGIEFIGEIETVVMRKTKLTSSDVFHSSMYPDQHYISINKEIGSRLCYLKIGAKEITNFLDQNRTKRQEK